MKKKSIYILKVILGGYLVFIGVSLFVLMQQQKPSNMIFLSVVGAVCAVIGISYAVYFLMKVFNIKNKDRQSDSGRFWKTAVGKTVAGIWNSVTGRLTRIHLKKRSHAVSDATEEMPAAEIRQMAAQTLYDIDEDKKQEKIPVPMPVVGEETEEKEPADMADKLPPEDEKEDSEKNMESGSEDDSPEQETGNEKMNDGK